MLFTRLVKNRPFSARNGYVSGGTSYGFKGSTIYNTIERHFIKVPGTATNNFGTLTTARSENAAMASQINGGRLLTVAGRSGAEVLLASIEVMENKTGGASTAYGNIRAAVAGGGGCANGSVGLFMGGYNNGVPSSAIDTMQIKVNANSTGFGDLNSTKFYNPCYANRGNMYSAFGQDGGNQAIDAIDTKSFKNSGTCSRFSSVAVSNTTVANSVFVCNEQQGLRMGGSTNALAATNVIEWVTLKTITVATSAGNLTAAKYAAGGAASQQRAFFIKGATAVGAAVATSDYTNFKSRANATTLGTLTGVKAYMGSYGGS